MACHVSQILLLATLAGIARMPPLGVLVFRFLGGETVGLGEIDWSCGYGVKKEPGTGAGRTSAVSDG